MKMTWRKENLSNEGVMGTMEQETKDKVKGVKQTRREGVGRGKRVG